MMTKLDKYWKYVKGMRCPLCGKAGLWEDTHEEKDATHFCKKCDDGLTIVGCCYARGTKESEQ